MSSAIMLAVMKSVGVPAPVAEYRFHATRKWRFDYAWPEYRVALEVEGGVWTGGRHTRGSGFMKDLDKYNAAASAGWLVLKCTPGTLNETATALLVAQAIYVSSRVTTQPTRTT